MTIWTVLCPLVPPTPRHECFQHVRDQSSGIDRLAVGLRVQRSVSAGTRRSHTSSTRC